MRRTKLMAASAAILLAGTLAGCGDAGNSDGGGTDVKVEENAADNFDDGTYMKELAEAGKITVGVKYDQPGLGFKGATDDIPSGFDVEIAKLLVANLGIDPEDIEVVTYEETISDNREPFLKEGKVDLVLASYSITDERRAEVGQTGPYFLTGQQVLVTADSDVAGIEDLAGMEVCSVTGSTSIDKINEQGAKGIGFDSYSECVQKVLDGSVAAMSTDGSILAGFAAQNEGELKVVGDEFSEERIGVGYSLDHPEMCEWINGVLEASFDDGSWADAFELTLGPSGVETPDPPALDECPAA